MNSKASNETILVTGAAGAINKMVNVSSTADELNILSGVSATSTELDLLSGAEAGKVKNGKTAVYSSNGELKSTKVGATPKSDIISWIKENI